MGKTAETTATVEMLRERIRQLKAAPRTYLSILRTGVGPLDAMLPAGGFPLGHAVELCGEAASGRTSVALRAVASAHAAGRLCAYVDGPGELYPPCAAALGVDLARLLVVRPRALKQVAWAALQLLRSGAFACVVLDLTHTGLRLLGPEGKRLADAAVKGGSLLLLLSSPDAPAEGMTRLKTSVLGVQGLEVEVVRSRHGGMERRALVPWEALYPAIAPQYRYQTELEQTQGEVSPVPRFHRPRTAELRNGPEGFHAQRPGQDMSLPMLGPSLGL